MSAATATVARAGLSRRVRRGLQVAVVLAVTVIVLAVAVFPTRQYLDQRAAIAEKEAVLERFERERARLAERKEALGTRGEIEQIARAEYGLVYPGEETYAILPPPASADQVPSLWPFDR